jgi:4-hydroxybenzoate polyprenyltransferase/phosphoserine phosphatase
MQPHPLYVDLDGTLIKSDLLHESLLGLLKREPWAAFLIPMWLMRGRASLKREIAERVDIDVASLPYSDSFVTFLREQAASGRELVLATASDAKYARQVAAHVGVFTASLSSDGTVNLSGERKLAAIEAHAQGRRFDYAGNSRQDVPIWDKSHGAILVNPDRGVEAAVRDRVQVTSRFLDRRTRVIDYLVALRPHQWAKNALLAVPLLMSHRFTDPVAVLQVLIAFIAFSLAASSVYLLNDLLDLGADRQHPRKRLRPFASGAVPVSRGLLLVPLLTLLSLVIAAQVSLPFVGALVAYLAITLAYSFRLKHYVLIDVLVLAALFTTRVIAGGVAIQALPSVWLLAFCVFVFTALALVKRCSELVTMERQGATAARGRDYRVSDGVPLMVMGIASGYASVLVVALYISSGAVTGLYSRAEWLWLLCPVLMYWISRLWLKTHRGEMHDDPLVFAMKDRASRILGVVSLAILLAAI